MKTLFFFSISIVFTLFISCTPKAYSPLYPEGYFDARYENLLDAGDQILKSRYQYVKVKTKDNRYVRRVYFPETKQITSEITYRSAGFKQKHGLSRTWSDDGSSSTSVSYTKGKRSGVEKSYYKDGSFTENGYYENGQKIGVWNHFDAQKRKLVEITYDKGIREGAFAKYDTLGQITNKGIYRADTIFEQTNPPKEVAHTMPYLKGCYPIPQAKKLDPCTEKKLLSAIFKDILYPTTSREYGVQGRAIVQFIIDEDGEMVNFKVLRGIDASISGELKRLFGKLATKLDWEPGIQDGEKVHVQYIMPVKFQLE